MFICISENKRKMYIGNNILLTITGYNYYARIIQKWWKKVYKKLIPCKRKYDIMNEAEDICLTYTNSDLDSDLEIEKIDEIDIGLTYTNSDLEIEKINENDEIKKNSYSYSYNIIKNFMKCVISKF